MNGLRMKPNPKVIKIIQRSEAEELAYQRWLSDIDFSRKPTWLQERLEGDKMADGSDEQEYVPEEQEN